MPAPISASGHSFDSIVHWHCFRHSVARDLGVVSRQKFLGHTSPAMTARYTRVDIEKIRAQPSWSSVALITGLDFFEARYFSSAQGRFTGPDPLVWVAWQSRRVLVGT
jgi:hypothetical protein